MYGCASRAELGGIKRVRPKPVGLGLVNRVALSDSDALENNRIVPHSGQKKRCRVEGGWTNCHDT